MRFFAALLMVVILLSAGDRSVVFSAQETSTSLVETATGPTGLLELEQQGKITVRALRAWGRLPDTYMKLAQKLRQDAGLDLLGADLNTIKDWISKGNAGDPSLAKMHDSLAELAAFIEQGAHLEWTIAADETHLPAGALARQNGKRWMVGAGQPAVPSSQAVATPQDEMKKEVQQ